MRYIGQLSFKNERTSCWWFVCSLGSKHLNLSSILWGCLGSKSIYVHELLECKAAMLFKTFIVHMECVLKKNKILVQFHLLKLLCRVLTSKNFHPHLFKKKYCIIFAITKANALICILIQKNQVSLAADINKNCWLLHSKRN